MDKTAAFKTLRLDQSADGHMIESAYWTLVRRAQSRGGEDGSREIEDLNEAYTVLSPDARMMMPERASSGPYAQAAYGILDTVADWVNDEAMRTRKRWPHRNPEIALIGGAALVLIVLALGAGASCWGVFVTAAVILGAIWAPWRRAETPVSPPPVEQAPARVRRNGTARESS
jgi:hypothetical protein